MAEDRVQRRLAAVLAADVVGYSRLMEQDDVGTLTRLKQRRTTIFEPLVAHHRGRIVKVMGDGVLVEFASAVNAVACAIELQRRMAEAGERDPEDRRILLRIGVNLGDVIVEGGDIYGDGVNIAARLEGIAEPGGICISGKVRDEVGGKLAIDCDDLGETLLKNIAIPVRAYRVIGTHGRASPAADPLPADKPSIAVLPFANMSGDPEQAYFSDGITEDIITELSRFRDLLVIARNSSFQYRDKNVDVKRIGRELGVQFVIEGSIRKLGDRVRITAQLIDAETGAHLWAERYDRDLRDIFALQDDLAHAVATTVGSRVEAARHERASRLSPAGLTAYDLVLRANASRLKFTRAENGLAQAQLLRAIGLDPANARAHAYYAHTCFMQYMADWTTDHDQSRIRALQSAKQAVTLDEADATARWVLGLVYLYSRNYDEARFQFEKACQLNPNEAEAIGHYGLFLSSVGEADKALDQLEIARRRNPVDPAWMPWLMGIAYFTARRYDQAIAVLSQIHEPINEVRLWLAASYAQVNRIAESEARLQEFLRVAEGDMAHFPGRSLKNWHPYLHGIMEYRDQQDFEHLFEALRKAGLSE